MALNPTRKRKRISKNKKKNWRKTDIDDVEEYLDDKRFEERTGGPVSEKLDAELFFVDKDEESECTVPSKREKWEGRQLRCHANLLPDPSIKPLKTIHNARKPENDAKRRSIRVLNSKKLSQSEKATKQLSRFGKATTLRRKPTGRNKDLWAENKDTEGEKIDSFHNQYTRKTLPKPPKHHYEKPSEVDAVEPAHPGQSYNPAFEDHQELISKATLVEEKKAKEELKLRKALDDQFPSKSEAPTEESYINEMSAGLFDASEPPQKFTEEELEKISLNPAVRREDKKTAKKRRKEKERREVEKHRLQAKEVKIRNNEYFRLKSIKKEIKLREKKLEERAKQKAKAREQNKNKPKRLGKLKYEEPDLEVKLSDELEGTLRQLKPEGNLLYDRFKSMQKRNIIKPTVRVKVVKNRWRRPKFAEKKSHKEITA